LKGKPLQPPKNSIANRADINIIFAYSARNSNAKDIEEYSTLYPDTNSDSPSVKSKGALFVSANADIKNIKAAGNIGNMNQTEFCCASIMLEIFKVPEHKIIVISISPIDTS
jgi:hypothetical protein